MILVTSCNSNRCICQTPPIKIMTSGCLNVIKNVLLVGGIVCFFVAVVVGIPYIKYGIPITLPTYQEQEKMCYDALQRTGNPAEMCFAVGRGGDNFPGRNNVSCIYCDMGGSFSYQDGTRNLWSASDCIPVGDGVTTSRNQSEFDQYASDRCVNRLSASVGRVHTIYHTDITVQNGSVWLSLAEYRHQQADARTEVGTFNANAPWTIIALCCSALFALCISRLICWHLEVVEYVKLISVEAPEGV